MNGVRRDPAVLDRDLEDPADLREHGPHGVRAHAPIEQVALMGGEGRNVERDERLIAESAEVVAQHPRVLLPGLRRECAGVRAPRSADELVERLLLACEFGGEHGAELPAASDVSVERGRVALAVERARALLPAGAATITIKLTPVGKRLLTHARQLMLTAKGTFTPTGKHAIMATKTLTLKR